MNELFNFHDSWIIVEYNWWVMLLAMVLGIWVGWSTTSSSLVRETDKGGS